MLTVDSFQKSLRELTQSKTFCVAFSGGLDSSVLLDLLSQLSVIETGISIRAIHIHHGLSANADRWADLCTTYCARYHIPLVIKHINIKRDNESVEEQARNLRYNVFKELLSEKEVLVTGHHRNDQAETLLLQLFRGAGPKGLASMPAATRFGKGLLARPLLGFDKESLKQYAEIQTLNWVEDESNRNLLFDRNYLRNSLLPLIQSRWPAVIENLSRAATHCANANHFIETQIADVFVEAFDPEQLTLSIPAVLKHALPVQNHIIRYWLQQLNLSLPSTQKLALLLKEIMNARPDAVPLLRWKNVEVRRYGDHLYAMRPLLKHSPNLVIDWDLQQDLPLPGDLGVIRLQEVEQLGLKLHELQEVSIRFRQGGEKCLLKNRQNRHCLKKLFQAWRIPPWRRDRIPLLYAQNRLKAIIGFVTCE
ncbi:MAG: tRNA lysidine(34) synthetase TilS [Gammaproteobacteria bacterium]|nr:tRNA lysidine(34) synthetase TilS [Gammaproteobacteria bacterium]